MAEFVSVDRLDNEGVPNASGPVAVLRLDRPPLNALSRVVIAEIGDAVEGLGGLDGLRAVIVYGGDKVFATESDPRDLAEAGTDRLIAGAPALTQGLRALRNLSVPTVAALGGYAVGAGATLALGVDRRIAGDHVKLCFPEVLLGVVPVGLDRLTRLIGPSRATDIALTGRFVDAAEALAIGLIDEVVPPDEVFDAALRWARAVSVGAPRAVAGVRALVDAAASESGGLDGDLEVRTLADLYATQDRVIGARSYLTHGPGRAQFTGR